MYRINFSIFAVAAVVLVACAPLSPSISDGKNYKVTQVTPQVIAQQRHILFGKNATTETPINETGYHYRLGSGDLLLAKLYIPSVASFDGYAQNRQILSDNWQEYNQILITDDGNATFPYIGDMHLAGKTLPEAKQELNKAMGKYFKKPQSVLEVKEYYDSKVFVMGEVSRPSMQRIKAGQMNVMEALSSSQGVNSVTASYSHIYVIRGVLEEVEVEDEDAKPIITADDNPLHIEIYQIDSSNGGGIAMAAQFPLQPNDVVYVSPSGITEWSRIITQLIPYNASYAINTGNTLQQ